MVNLQDMLDCREERYRNQKKLIAKFGNPLISFTMNIAGPVKTNGLIRRAFKLGLRRIDGAMLREKIGIEEKIIKYNETGPEALYSVKCEALFLKKITAEIEDYQEIGRLFDIDVIDTDEKKINREKERSCLICGNNAKECSSRRIHDASTLFKKTEEILKRMLDEEDSNLISSLAVRSLLYEVCISPKPGLVDRFGNGSHSDMNIFTFLTSASSLYSYFKVAVKIGMNYEKNSFEELRKNGKIAECDMFLHTCGINTHKGAIFSMGIMCAAIGMCIKDNEFKTESVLKNCAEISKGISKKDFNKKRTSSMSAGERLFFEHDINSVRFEAENGFPSIREAYYLFEKLYDETKDIDLSGVNALLKIMSVADDSNVFSRAGIDEMKSLKERCKMISGQRIVDDKTFEGLDREFKEKNISPGGSADLLSLCILLYFFRKNYYV